MSRADYLNYGFLLLSAVFSYFIPRVGHYGAVAVGFVGVCLIVRGQLKKDEEGFGSVPTLAGALREGARSVVSDIQKSPGGSNLKVVALSLPRIQFEDGTWCRGDGRGFDSLSHAVVIRNEAQRSEQVATVTVRAELRCHKPSGTYTHSPLCWIGIKEPEARIGAGESRELVLAVQTVLGQDQWDWAVHSTSPSDRIWIDLFETFEFEIRLIDVETGEILSTEPPLCFLWEWPYRDPPGIPSKRIYTCRSDR
jgi:hypothetical protein